MALTVTIRGKEYDLQDSNLEEIMSTLTPEEEEDVERQIMAIMGAETKEEAEAMIDNMEEQLQEQQEQPMFKPITLDFDDYDLDLFVQGIDKVSGIAGEYTALINAGMSSKQAFDLISDACNREHELLALRIQMEHQLKMKEMELQAQVKINGLQALVTEE